MDSSFHMKWDLGYLTNLRTSIVGQMYLTCLEVGWVGIGIVVSCSPSSSLSI